MCKHSITATDPLRQQAEPAGGARRGVRPAGGVEVCHPRLRSAEVDPHTRGLELIRVQVGGHVPVGRYRRTTASWRTTRTWAATPSAPAWSMTPTTAPST